MTEPRVVRVPVPPPDVGGDDARAREVIAEGRRIALFRLGDEVVALDGTCLHRGGPIALGDVRDGIVTCPWHWWRYRIATGERVDAPEIRLRRYPVEIRDGIVTVAVPPAVEPESWRDRLLRAAHARAVQEETEAGRPGGDAARAGAGAAQSGDEVGA